MEIVPFQLNQWDIKALFEVPSRETAAGVTGQKVSWYVRYSSSTTHTALIVARYQLEDPLSKKIGHGHRQPDTTSSRTVQHPCVGWSVTQPKLVAKLSLARVRAFSCEPPQPVAMLPPG